MRVTYILIALCVLVFFLENAAPEIFLSEVVLGPISLLGSPWTIFTSMFGHGDVGHLLFNMLALFMFGSVLEDRIGSNKFLFLYFMSGILGSVGFMLLNSPFDMALGASGAIYGVIGALVLIAPNLLVYFYGIPIPMYAAGPIYALIEIFALGRVDNIAHSAHLLGFFSGLVLAWREPKENWPPRMPMPLWMAVGIPIVLSLVVGIAFGAYYLSDQLNQKILSCENKDQMSAKACFLDVAKEYKNNPQQKSYICDEYERFFDDKVCRGV